MGSTKSLAKCEEETEVLDQYSGESDDSGTESSTEGKTSSKQENEASIIGKNKFNPTAIIAHQSLPHPLKFSGDHLVDAFDTKRVEVSRTQTNLPLYSFSAEHIKIKQKYDALITKWETAETSDLNLDGMRERIRTAENWDLNPDDPNRLSRQRTMTARRVARSEERPRPSTAKAYPTLFDDKSIMLRGSFRNRNSLFPGREIETQIAHAQLENVSKQQMNRTHRAQQQPEEELSIPGQTAFPGRPWTRDMPRLSMFAGGERRKDGLEQEKDSLDSSSVLELGSFVTITTPTPQPVIQPSGSANQQDSPQLNLSQSVVILEPQSTDQTEMMDVSRMETFLSQTPPQTPGNVVLSSPLKSTEESYDDYERESEPLSVKTLSLQTSPCRPAPSPNLSQDIQKEEVIEATIIPTSVDSPEEPRTPNLVTSTDPLFIPPIIFPPQILTPRPSPETSSTQHNTSDLSVAVSPTTRSPRTGSPPVHLQRPATSSQRVKTPSSIKHVHIVKRHLQSDPQSNRTTPNFSQRRSSTRELVGLNTPRSLKTDSRNYPAHILIFPQKTKRVDPLPVRNSFLLVRGGKAP
ncbi:hypothetical protein BLNAU_11586 [Blattamonas nauphoetae]|uniref:Uncharacterized protein n=1 Tax=Blattamonas nauphoetae TaxID=2049346 RepID=A0ABQ9XM15_9EUKA|nr:hypothetical protein BLNAU_11586 [Blattamonas nauphoetae]